MTWDHFSSYQALVDQPFGEKKEGLDVIIPTVFRLTVDGWVLNNLDKTYVDKAKSLGYQVHGLFDNQFDPELTSATLANEILVKRVIDQLIFYAIYYELDGINLDFENVNVEDSDAITSFVSDLRDKSLDLGLTLSIDVTRPGGSDNWSKFISRSDVARYVDYIILMAYDEHWATSPKAGSVASIPWVEESIKLMLKEVPKHKLILGVPTYMRVWTETKVSDSTEVKSSALSMVNLYDFISKHDVYKEYDEVTGQTYYEMQGDAENQTLKIWAEDERSVTSRIKLIKKYDLAGISSWRNGFEVSAFWEWINDNLDD
jgi:spore germination protein YaaH